jgi:hypothetical protein
MEDEEDEETSREREKVMPNDVCNSLEIDFRR